MFFRLMEFSISLILPRRPFKLNWRKNALSGTSTATANCCCGYCREVAKTMKTCTTKIMTHWGLHWRSRKQCSPYCYTPVSALSRNDSGMAPTPFGQALSRCNSPRSLEIKFLFIIPPEFRFECTIPFCCHRFFPFFAFNYCDVFLCCCRK